jgi:O-antigen/teichoic acid export membrane protein
MAVVFFMAPFLIHRIGEAHYGVYLFLASISGMLGVLNLGLGEATLRYVAYHDARGDNEGVNRVIGATLFVYVIMGIIAAAVLFVFAPLVGGLLGESPVDNNVITMLVRVTSLGFLVRFLAGVFLSLPQAVLRYDLYARLVLSESIVRTIGQILVILAGCGLAGLIIWNVAVGVLLLLATVFMARHIVPGLRLWQLPSGRGLKEVFGYGVFAFLSQILGLVWQYADRLLLGAFIGASAIAFFAVPQELAMRFLGLVAAAGAVLFPKFSRTDDRQSVRTLYLQSTSALLSLTLMLFVPLAVLFPDFIRLWVSPAFAKESGHIAVLIASSCLIRGAFIPYEGLFRGIGKPQFCLAVIALSSATILLCDLILIPRYGVRGAGYAFCISPMWGIAAMVFVWRKIFGRRSFRDLLRAAGGPFIVGVLALLAGFWLRSFFPAEIGWFVMIALCLALLAVSFVSLVLYGSAIGVPMPLLAYSVSLVRRSSSFRALRTR